MAWIESHTSLERHPKLLLLKSRMRWSRNESVGFLHRFWWTVLEYAPNGVISALPPAVMSETLDMNVDEYERLLIALEEIGWIDRVGTRLQVHDWLDYARMYLRDNKFKNKPEKFKEVESLYEIVPADALRKTRKSSAESLRKVCGTKPTNQPTNQPRSPAAAGGSFGAFWAAWPRHRRKADRPKCEKQWASARLDEHAGAIMAALAAFKTSPDWTKEGGQYIPAPIVWLRGQRWEVPLESLQADEAEPSGFTRSEVTNEILAAAGLPELEEK